MSDINDVLQGNMDSTYDVTYELQTVVMELPYGKRGRLLKDWVSDTRME